MFLLPLCCLAVDMTICCKSLIPSQCWSDAGVLSIAERLSPAAEFPRWRCVQARGQNHLLALYRQDCADSKLIEGFCGFKEIRL